MVRRDRRVVGDSAEDLAFGYLQDRGLTPVKRNFTCRFGEIDLIMRDTSCLVVIEVRYRGDRSFVTAEQTVDRRKQAKIIRTTGLFLAWNQRYAALPVRFDVVGIDADSKGNQTIRWLRDAFRPRGNQL